MIEHWLKTIKSIEVTNEDLISAQMQIFENGMDLSKFEIAILGFHTNQADILRGAFYNLKSVNEHQKIVDLGNLISPNLTSLLSVYEEIQNLNLTLLIFGLPDDDIAGLITCINSIKPKSSKLVISDGYGIEAYHDVMDQISFCGVQSHNMTVEYRDIIEKSKTTSLGLGDLRKDVANIEPIIRQCHNIYLSSSAIKYSDSPCQERTSTSGLTSEELCQIMHYCGFSMNCHMIAMSGLKNLGDDKISQNTLSQALWYFINAHATRKERKDVSNKNLQHYLVDINDLEDPLEFKHNTSTGEWWFNLTIDGSKRLIACNQQDYDSAMNNQIPERYFELLK